MLRDTDRLVRSRIHPLKVLIAQRAYAGEGRSGIGWKADQQIVAALEDAFISPSSGHADRKARLVALDVSGSMSDGNVAGPG